MTLDEAIDRNEELRSELIRYGRLGMAKSVGLSIEALKLVKEYYNYFIREGVVPLPGETEK